MPTVSVNAVDYETYATVAEADQYLAADISLYSAWSSLANDLKARALVTSTRYLESLPWKGTKTSDSQILEWPRTGTGLDDVEDSVVPQDIIDGSIVFAALVSNDASILSSTSQDENTRRLKAGSVEIEFFRYQEGPVVVKRLFDLIGRYLSGQGNVALVFNTTGTQQPRFDEDAYGLSEGF